MLCERMRIIICMTLSMGLFMRAMGLERVRPAMLDGADLRDEQTQRGQQGEEVRWQMAEARHGCAV